MAPGSVAAAVGAGHAVEARAVVAVGVGAVGEHVLIIVSAIVTDLSRKAEEAASVGAPADS